VPLRRSRLTVHVPTVLCGILYHAMPWTNPPSNKVSVAQSVNQEAFLLTPLLELTSCYPFLESTLLAAPGMRARLYDQLIPCRAHVSLCRSSRIVLRQDTPVPAVGGGERASLVSESTSSVVLRRNVPWLGSWMRRQEGLRICEPLRGRPLVAMWHSDRGQDRGPSLLSYLTVCSAGLREGRRGARMDGGAWVIIVCPAVTRCAGEGGLATDVLGWARQGGASFSRGAGGGRGKGGDPPSPC
jgi:hypothetical protein